MPSPCPTGAAERAGRRQTGKSRNRIRRTIGSGLAEIAFATVILITLAIFTVDIGGAMVCYGVNDRACRDAARAAAQGSSEVEARRMAGQILQSYAINSPLINSPALQQLVYRDFNGDPPPGTSATVTVTTSAAAHPVAAIGLLGADIIGKDFSVRKSYTFPIVKLSVPSSQTARSQR